MNRSCERCGVSIDDKPSAQRYCSLSCSSRRHDGCSVEGCERPHIARGLCRFHWKHEHGKPNRKVEVPCGYCGTAVLKEANRKFANRFCSLACRDIWRRWADSPACAVPDSHPSRSSPIPANHPSRVALACAVPLSHPSRAPRRVWSAGYCADCGMGYVNGSEWTTHSKYCSRRCQRRVSRRNRRGREYGATGSFTWDGFVRLAIAVGNVCAYCGTDNDGQPFEPDHVLPLSRNGHNGLTNILPACRSCNGDKRDLLVHEWATDRTRRGLPPLRYDVERFGHLTAHALSVDQAA